MKRLTLDQTWEQCLKMWKLISLCKGRGTNKSIDELKIEWLSKTKIRVLQDNCFFCEKAMKDSQKRKLAWFYPSCNTCPAKKVDNSFNCLNNDYNFKGEPRKFYAKLKELNKIRLETK
jgi:hypothetical protein